VLWGSTQLISFMNLDCKRSLRSCLNPYSDWLSLSPLHMTISLGIIAGVLFAKLKLKDTYTWSSNMIGYFRALELLTKGQTMAPALRM